MSEEHISVHALEQLNDIVEHENYLKLLGFVPKDFFEKKEAVNVSLKSEDNPMEISIEKINKSEVMLSQYLFIGEEKLITTSMIFKTDHYIKNLKGICLIEGSRTKEKIHNIGKDEKQNKIETIPLLNSYAYNWIEVTKGDDYKINSMELRYHDKAVVVDYDDNGKESKVSGSKRAVNSYNKSKMKEARKEAKNKNFER